MPKSYEFREVIGADKPGSFYVDGRRVSRQRYYELKDACERLDTFMTEGKQVGSGRIRRTNYCIGYLP